MFRIVDRPLSFRQRANQWIYKMLFLWTREPAPGPRAGPWFAWFATAVLLWRCRRRITKTILAVSPLRLLRRRAPFTPVIAKASSTAETTTRKQQTNQQKIPQRRHKGTGIRTKIKRLCTGDGPHVTATNKSTSQTDQQINYKVTRSGRVYGIYQNKVPISTEE